MTTAFYTQDETKRGFVYMPGETPEWWQFAEAPTPLPPNVNSRQWISALTCDPTDPAKMYAVWVDDKYLRVSTDGGVTWSRSSAFPAEATTPSPIVYSLAARAGQVFLCNANPSDTTYQGIWRSVDDGVNWTRVANTLGRGYMALADTKLWYATGVATGGIDFRRMNLDGTGIETIAHVSNTSRQIMRALSDDLCLATNYTNTLLHRLEPSGATDIRPASFRPWDAIPLSASTFLTVGVATPFVNFNVLVYRSTTAGSSWTLVKTIPEAEGFAAHGTPNLYYMVDASLPARTSLVMNGDATPTIKQNFWLSDDAGSTWATITNPIDPLTSRFGIAGVVARAAVTPLTATPSRLATIVG